MRQTALLSHIPLTRHSYYERLVQAEPLYRYCETLCKRFGSVTCTTLIV